MDLADRLAKEHRLRLAAERLLEQKSRELFAANQSLALHACNLSNQIVEQRQKAKNCLLEAEELKDQNGRYADDIAAANAAAAMAERRLWDSIETLHDGFAIFDAKERLVAANRSYLGAFDQSRISIGMHYAELLRNVARDGMLVIEPPGLEEWVARMCARWQQDIVPDVDLHLTNGQWIRLSERRTRDGDMVSLARDITENMRVWAAIEAIPDGFVLYGRDERLLYCNQRFLEIFGFVEDAPLRGKSFDELLHLALSKGVFEIDDAQGEHWCAEQIRRFRRSEEVYEQHMHDGRWIRAYNRLTPDGGRVGLRVDITRIRAQQRALEDAHAGAEAATRAKSAFLANMSHEIRTPMNGVVGMAELLCRTGLSEEQRLFAETIKSSGEALLVIIDEILDYSKLEAERLTLRPEPFDLERTIHEVAMLLQPRALSKGIDLIVDFDLFLPTRYLGDQVRLRQILTNLLGNAVKFTFVGHVLLRVVGVETAPAQRQLHITVEDTGIGISAEHRSYIFGEFNQVEAERNRKFEGTGLGLAITRGLVERMGGEIWVDSEVGRGSCFGFILTLPVTEETQLPPLPLAVRRILVVDDQLINRTILERQLKPFGVEVVLCRSGANALWLLSQDHGFDLALIDHEMPEMDGLTLADRIAEIAVKIPLLLMSANPALAREQAGSLPLAAVMQKPLLRADLLNRLQAVTVEVPPQVVAPPADEPAAPLRRMRVLLAEDNRTNQLVFHKMTKDCGIDLLLANNGQEAIKSFEKAAPDLIFMDISMPVVDGREAAMAIRVLEDRRSHVPIIALTAHAMQGDAEQILAAGIDRYLTKPLSRAAIIALLVEFCPPEARGIIQPGPARS
jgi:signal transduction histidine kinase/DNA-binding response OmpR family regulator